MLHQPSSQVPHLSQRQSPRCSPPSAKTPCLPQLSRWQPPPQLLPQVIASTISISISISISITISFTIACFATFHSLAPGIPPIKCPHCGTDTATVALLHQQVPFFYTNTQPFGPSNYFTHPPPPPPLSVCFSWRNHSPIPFCVAWKLKLLQRRLPSLLCIACHVDITECDCELHYLLTPVHANSAMISR